jgi:hypothetical protein
MRNAKYCVFWPSIRENHNIFFRYQQVRIRFNLLVRVSDSPDRNVSFLTAPNTFFLYAARLRLIATYCGIRIDPKARVIDVFGEPIQNLYACGEVVGGVHGAAYMTGTAVAKAMAFGRIAALEIARLYAWPCDHLTDKYLSARNLFGGSGPHCSFCLRKDELLVGRPFEEHLT